MPKSVGTGLDSPDTSSWKPTGTKGDNGDKGRDMTRKNEKLQRDNANPSR